MFEEFHVSEIYRPHAAALRVGARRPPPVLPVTSRKQRLVTPIHDLTLYAAAHPWALTAAVLLVFIALIAVLILVWMHRFEGVLALYHDGDGGDPHCIYLDNGAIRLEIIRRRAAWNFRVTPLLGSLQADQVVVATLRADGLGQRFVFDRRNGRLESTAKVREPLTFVAHVSITRGSTVSEFVVLFDGTEKDGALVRPADGARAA